MYRATRDRGVLWEWSIRGDAIDVGPAPRPEASPSEATR